MVRAKLLKPGVFHYCKECKSESAGAPTTVDGWVDKDGDFIGSIEEFPTREDAENGCDPEYRPVERLVAKRCGQHCTIKANEADEKLSVYSYWTCDYCQTNHKSKDVAGDCCD